MKFLKELKLELLLLLIICVGFALFALKMIISGGQLPPSPSSEGQPTSGRGLGILLFLMALCFIGILLGLPSAMKKERKHLESFLSKPPPVHHVNARVKTVKITGDKNRSKVITVEFECQDGVVREFKSNTLRGLKLKDFHFVSGDKGILTYKVHEGRKVESYAEGFGERTYVKRYETEFISFNESMMAEELEEMSAKANDVTTQDPI